MPLDDGFAAAGEGGALEPPAEWHRSQCGGVRLQPGVPVADGLGISGIIGGSDGRRGWAGADPNQFGG